MSSNLDNIFAISTGFSKSAIAVFRISGPNSKSILPYLTTRKNFEPRKTYLLNIIDPRNHDVIDKGFVIFFPKPKSFTGEDMVEFHLHGSIAVINYAIDVLSSFDRFRLADPGEFTKRALHNGKLSVDQVEALSDLISSETSEQRKLAINSLKGSLSVFSEDLISSLLKVMASMEASIEFPDELNEDSFQNYNTKIQDIIIQIKELLSRYHLVERVRSGFNVSIIGPPNAGKSSLLNTLSGRSAAIVSTEPGTTRDLIEVKLDLSGYAINLIDTAGIRSTKSRLELEGISRAKQSGLDSDFIICVLDSTSSNEFIIPIELKNKDILFVYNKCDLLDSIDSKKAIYISCKTGYGIESIENNLKNKIKTLNIKDNSLPILVSRKRQFDILNDCVISLERCIRQNIDELAIEDLRLAIRYLGKISGRVEIESMLDLLFKEFCIGK
ncbi:tRNA uridine-5-carboxymethylaminomethyl(34) synthesis GTPase MnmE [Alphaproteobacteria bacterium]|nr:tRNA uridine-5-carboxymethylaminomethyl(34) synthesis GTPase MnmE [Alphaproteobacteria bacterium]